MLQYVSIGKKDFKDRKKNGENRLGFNEKGDGRYETWRGFRGMKDRKMTVMKMTRSQNNKSKR